ncbi:MAG: sulfatase-like hydrolase/transferase [Tidjanibacter sp.]|nr:sulfatase-like hydrolase/transferase [Tidjanibacter sp.]
MKKRILFIITLFFGLTVLFALQKPLFMLYNHALTEGTTAGDWLAVMWNGLSLDMTIAGYISLLPVLLVVASIWIKGQFWKTVLKCYFGLIAVVCSLIFIGDMALYPYWGFKLNSSIWFYLASPKDAAASLELWPTVMQVLFIIIYVWLFYKAVTRFILPILFKEEQPDRRILSTAVCILLLGVLFLPIRGGVHASVANEGKVYFSSNMFLNHSAVNPCFTLLDSSMRQQSYAEQYHYMDSEEARNIVAELTARQEGVADSTRMLLRTDRPNVVLVILEGFAGTTVGAVGGDSEITPNLNAAAAEGVTFNHIYANSFRTDRGLVSVLNGYPAQPASSIMKHPAKSQTLPGIAQHLRQAGYRTSIYYGGDIDFTNMRSFFYGSGFESVTGQDGLSFDAPMAQWGYDDRLMCNFFGDKVLEIAEESDEPFFTTLLTLSSHEPFDVPYSRLDHHYTNSVAFTDDCLGDMFEKLRSSDIWDETLVILLPDHSFLWPETITRCSPENHHVFMVWTGGAVAEPTIVERTGTQTDLAATLLAQLSLPTEEFSFSKNLLNESAPEFAFYTFYNGFGMIDKEGNSVVWDCTSDSETLGNGANTDQLATQGKAYLQMLMEDFDKR